MKNFMLALLLSFVGSFTFGQSLDPPPADAPGQRQWLLAHMIVDMQMRGVYNSSAYHQVEEMVKTKNDQQIGAMVNYYQVKKSQMDPQQYSEAVANLQRLEAYRRARLQELEQQQSYQIVIQPGYWPWGYLGYTGYWPWGYYHTYHNNYSPYNYGYRGYGYNYGGYHTHYTPHPHPHYPAPHPHYSAPAPHHYNAPRPHYSAPAPHFTIPNPRYHR